MIPYGRHHIDARDIRAVVSVLRSNYVTQGPEILRFEKAFAKYCGAPYAVAVSSGTAGLHLSALAAGFEPGDRVITTPMTFVATVNCLLYAGATPVFADIDDTTIGIDPARALAARNARTCGLVAVDFAGQPWRGAAKNGLEPARNFTVIEDACHALGSESLAGGKWKKTGCGRNADMTVFSFHPVKHITTGEGGMITTRRKDLYERLLLLRSHGIERDPSRFKDRAKAREPWQYEMQSLGFNYRMTDIQCALGLSQLSKIDGFVTKRRRIAEFYDRRFAALPGVRVPSRIAGTRSSYHLYVLRVDFARIRTTRAEFMRKLKEAGVGSQVHYIPVTRQPYYRDRFGAQALPVSDRYYDEALSIPMYPGLKRVEMVKVADTVEKILTGGRHA